MHGGSAPQVRDAARQRLLALVDPALAAIEGNLKCRTKNPQVAQRAAEDILDRVGVTAPTPEELEPFEVEPHQAPVDYSCLSTEDFEHLQRIALIVDAHRKRKDADAALPSAPQAAGIQAPVSDDWGL